MKKEKKFSVKELLKTILYAIVVVNFIVFTVTFVEEIPNLILSEAIQAADADSEFLIEVGKSLDESAEEYITTQKEKYGEEYPATGILVQHMICSLVSGTIIQNYVISLLLGTILGTIIYIVSVQKAKGIELVIEIFIAFIVIAIITAGINLGYQAIINKAINVERATDTFYYTYLYGDSIFLPYIAVFAVVYIGNMIQQKILTNKLNKELNNN